MTRGERECFTVTGQDQRHHLGGTLSATVRGETGTDADTAAATVPNPVTSLDRLRGGFPTGRLFCGCHTGSRYTTRTPEPGHCVTSDRVGENDQTSSVMVVHADAGITDVAGDANPM